MGMTGAKRRPPASAVGERARIVQAVNVNE